jgi:plastocyanin
MRRFAALAVVAFSSLALAACSGSDGATDAPATVAATAPAEASAPAEGGCATSSEAGAVTVTIADFAYEPAEAEASVGETVSWTNEDAAGHTATLDDGGCDTGTIGGGSSGALVFNAAGTFAYHCTIHPTMTGTITVTE